MSITLETRSLLLGLLLCALLSIVVPTSAHAAAIGPRAKAQGTALGKSVKSETCNDFTSAALAVDGAGYVDAEESDTEKDGGTCDITYTDNSTGTLSWTAGKETYTPHTAGGSAVKTAVTTTADSNAGDNKTLSNADAGSCGPLNPLSWGDCILRSVGFFILTLTGFLLGIVGVLLNWVVVKTVFQFSTLVGNSQGLIIAWGILRDIGNLVLLFGFVLMGIGTILDTGKLPDKRAIPKLIIFAVLLNFSIFAAEAVIDTSNVLTTVLYSQANTNPCVDDNCNINNGIAGHIMQATGLSGIYALEGAKDISGAGTGNTQIIVMLGLSLFGVVGIVVLLATAIMLAFRAIVLTGLIILSPIGFAGMAIQPLEKTAKKWWNALIHQAFFAPILFLLIFVDLKVTEGFSSATNNNNLASALTGATGTSNMGIIMVFLLVSGGLVAALMAAKNFGAMGADIAIQTAGKIAGRTTFGTGALVARQTVGNASNFAARKLNESTWARNSRFGRLAISTAQAGANASYDVRGSKAFGSAVGAVNKNTKLGLDLGKPQGAAAKGYAGIEKRDTDARVKHGKGLKMSEAEEDTKKDIETELKDIQTTTKKTKDDLTVKENGLKSDRKEAEKVVEKGTPEFDSQISNLSAKAAANKDGAAVNDLERQISAEKLNGQRALSLGSIQDAAASERRVKELETQKDEYANASTKLVELEKAKASKLAEAQEEVDRIDKELKQITTDKENADKVLESRTAILNQHLDAINPQKQYIETLERNKLTGGQANKSAIKQLQAGLKETKTEKALKGLKDVLDRGEKPDEAIAKVGEAISESEEKSDEATGSK